MKSKLLLCVFLAATLSACATTGNKDQSERKGNLYMDNGTQALMEGRFADALSSLSQAVKFLPKHAGAWNNLGLAFHNKDEPKRAEEAWKKALALDSSFTDAHTNLGALYLQQKRYKEAEQEFKEASKDLSYLKMHQVNYNLALVYLQQRKNINAEQQLKLAVQAEPGFCAAWYKLGNLQKERGEFSTATESIKKSVSGPCFNNPEIHFEISSLYMKQREYGQAKSKLLEIIQLFPQSEWAKKAEITLNIMR
jgi:type IV pilus biogenesis/stability protein PilW